MSSIHTRTERYWRDRIALEPEGPRPGRSALDREAAARSRRNSPPAHGRARLRRSAPARDLCADRPDSARLSPRAAGAAVRPAAHAAALAWVDAVDDRGAHVHV